MAWLLVWLLILISALENPTPAAPLTLATILFLWGLGGAFCEVGCDLPILAEVAAASVSSRASMIAYKRAVQGMINPLGAPIAGLLAENVYGYRATTEAVGALDAAHRTANALALGSSLRTLALVCWPVCLVGYSSVGRVYEEHQREMQARRSKLPEGASSGFDGERESLLSK